MGAIYRQSTIFKSNDTSCIISIMEMFELRYFLGAAETENLQVAARKLRVAPSSLSKAIARLESELGVSLFSREGRAIRLTDHGLLLKKDAGEIVALEEATRARISGHEGELLAVIAGPEVLLSEIGLKLTERIMKREPGARFELQACDEREAIQRVTSGAAQLALVTREAPTGLASRSMGSTAFETCAGPGHPLYKFAGTGRAVPIEELLKHPFVSPSHAFLGQVGIRQSSDGWRDDRFPRRVKYVTSSLELLGELVASGRALAYLPDYWARRLGAKKLTITGCPYSCKQKIRLLARDPKRVGWINALFGD